MGRKFALLFFLLFAISTTISHASDPPPSSEYETLRRRVEWNIDNMWKFSKTLWNSTDNYNSSLKLLAEHKNSLLNDMELLRIHDGHEQWRQRELQELSDLVQRRLQHLQNPKNCATARKVKCELSLYAGFGSRIHHVVKCLEFAYITNRTLILDSNYRVYGSELFGYFWQDVFLPLSTTCLTSDGSTTVKWEVGGSINETDTVQVLETPQIHQVNIFPNYSMVIPSDLAPRLKRVHGDPIVWWIAQFLRYIWRFQPEVQRMVERRANEVNFSLPIVGVHIRRTDKLIADSILHSLEEYMEVVEDYFDRWEMRADVALLKKRRIFIATDDPEVITEARLKYPRYEIHADQQVATLGSKSADFSGIVTDVEMLSRCDYLVCTMSSNICKLAYELRLARDQRASVAGKYYSLDSNYFMYRKPWRKHTATLAHKKNGRMEMNLLLGDSISDRGLHQHDYLSKGFGWGRNLRTKKTGKFPLFKTDEEIVTKDFPTYPNV